MTGRSTACGCSTSAPGSRRRSAPGCSASRAPRSSRSSSPAPATSCGRSARSSTGYSLFWAVEGRGRKSVTLDLRQPDGARPVPAAGRHGRRRVRELPARHARALGHRSRPTRSSPRVACASPPSARTVPTRSGPGLDRVGIGFGGLLHLTGYPDRPPVRVGVTISDYLTGVFAAQAATAALYRRDAGPAGDRRRVRSSTPPSTARCCASSSGRSPAYDRLGVVREPGGQPAGQLGAARQLPHRRRQVRVRRRRQRRQLRPAVRRPWVGPSSPTIHGATGWPSGPRAATRSTASSPTWTRTLTAARGRRRCVAHDVPVATAYTAADIFADPHIAARGDLVTRRRPGGRTGPPAGAVPPLRRRGPWPCPRAHPCSARTPARCSPSCSASTTPSSTVSPPTA